MPLQRLALLSCMAACSVGRVLTCFRWAAYAAGGLGRRPLEPQNDAYEWGMSDADSSGMPKQLFLGSLSRHNGVMSRCLDCATNIICRGSGGRLAIPAGSARGGARSQSYRVDRF